MTTTKARYMNVSVTAKFPDTSEVEDIVKKAVKGMAGKTVNEETKRQLINEIAAAVIDKTTYELSVLS